MERYRMVPEETAVLVIDLQERLAAAMEPEVLQRTVNRTLALLEGARVLALPVVLTEQYPKGLGPTIGPIREKLGELRAVEKVRFTCALEEVLERLGDRRRVVICGMETHVCVFQTVRDLAERDLVPYVCVDAVLSRTPSDREVGLGLCREVGAVITSVETVLLDLLGTSGTPQFKAISAAIR